MNRNADVRREPGASAAGAEVAPEARSAGKGEAAEFHCWYARDEEEAVRKGRIILSKSEKFLREGPIVDLGCGEGALLLGLQRAGYQRVLGVDSNEELLSLARSFGVPAVSAELGEYLKRNELEPGVYFYVDVMEHVPFELNLLLLERLPVGSRLIIQTPYTQSLMGHQYYLNVPSHLAPYSPWVIRKMLDRFGYRVVGDGTVDGNHVPTWKNRLRAYFIDKVLAVDPDMILGGGNYYVVADRVPGER